MCAVLGADSTGCSVRALDWRSVAKRLQLTASPSEASTVNQMRAFSSTTELQLLDDSKYEQLERIMDEVVAGEDGSRNLFEQLLHDWLMILIEIRRLKLSRPLPDPTLPALVAPLAASESMEKWTVRDVSACLERLGLPSQNTSVDGPRLITMSRAHVANKFGLDEYESKVLVDHVDQLLHRRCRSDYDDNVEFWSVGQAASFLMDEGLFVAADMATKASVDGKGLLQLAACNALIDLQLTHEQADALARSLRDLQRSERSAAEAILRQGDMLRRLPEVYAWSPADVSKFLREVGVAEQAVQLAFDANVDGKTLLILEPDDMSADLGLLDDEVAEVMAALAAMEEQHRHADESENASATASTSPLPKMAGIVHRVTAEALREYAEKRGSPSRIANANPSSADSKQAASPRQSTGMAAALAATDVGAGQSVPVPALQTGSDQSSPSGGRKSSEAPQDGPVEAIAPEPSIPLDSNAIDEMLKGLFVRCCDRQVDELFEAQAEMRRIRELEAAKAAIRGALEQNLLPVDCDVEVLSQAAPKDVVAAMDHVKEDATVADQALAMKLTEVRMMFETSRDHVAAEMSDLGKLVEKERERDRREEQQRMLAQHELENERTLVQQANARKMMLLEEERHGLAEQLQREHGKRDLELKLAVEKQLAAATELQQERESALQSDCDRLKRDLETTKRLLAADNTLSEIEKLRDEIAALRRSRDHRDANATARWSKLDSEETRLRAELAAAPHAHAARRMAELQSSLREARTADVSEFRAHVDQMLKCGEQDEIAQRLAQIEANNLNATRRLAKLTNALQKEALDAELTMQQLRAKHAESQLLQAQRNAAIDQQKSELRRAVETGKATQVGLDELEQLGEDIVRLHSEGFGIARHIASAVARASAEQTGRVTQALIVYAGTSPVEDEDRLTHIMMHLRQYQGSLAPYVDQVRPLSAQAAAALRKYTTKLQEIAPGPKRTLAETGNLFRSVSKRARAVDKKPHLWEVVADVTAAALKEYQNTHREKDIIELCQGRVAEYRRMVAELTRLTSELQECEYARLSKLSLEVEQQEAARRDDARNAADKAAMEQAKLQLEQDARLEAMRLAQEEAKARLLREEADRKDEARRLQQEEAARRAEAARLLQTHEEDKRREARIAGEEAARRRATTLPTAPWEIDRQQALHDKAAPPLRSRVDSIDEATRHKIAELEGLMNAISQAHSTAFDIVSFSGVFDVNHDGVVDENEIEGLVARYNEAAE